MRGDLLALPPRASYDAILARGVLNDLVEDSERDAVFPTFAGALGAGGVLLLDVRDWEATAADRSRRPVVEKRVQTARGPLTFRTVTRLEPATHRMLISETHILAAGGGETTARYEFTMRCWTREELAARLGRAGFAAIEYPPGYETGAGAGGDRIVAVASRRAE